MIKPIILYGDDILRKTSVPFFIGENLDDIIKDLWCTLSSVPGVGLAGPQIGLNKQIFVINLWDNFFKKVFINPKISNSFGETVEMEEGCLSIPNRRGDVKRKENIFIEYYDENWNFHKKEFSGMISRVIQHEYDHLNGILWIDKINYF